jgi:hypothetical protein
MFELELGVDDMAFCLVVCVIEKSDAVYDCLDGLLFTSRR